MANDNKGRIGIYFDSRSITVVQARSQGGRVEVVARGAADTPAGAIEGANILDPSRVAQAIRGLLREMRLTGRSASVVLPYQGYSLRSVRLPDVPEDERAMLVRNELEEAGALPPRACTLDFLWLAAPSEPGKRTIDAVSFYTGDLQVDHVRELLQQAGLQMARLEPECVSMTRAYLMSRPAPEPVAILCVAHNHSDLCIHDGRTVRSMRRIPSGWGDLRPAQPSGSAHYPFRTEPENRTAGPGAASPKAGPSRPYDLGEEPRFMAGQWPVPSQDAPPPAEGVDSMVQSAPGFAVTGPTGSAPVSRLDTTDITFLASEVARSLAFFAREYPDAPRPRAVVVLGPESVSEILAPLLEAALPLPVKAGDALTGFDMPRPILLGEASAAVGSLAAIGVALDGAENFFPAIDLSNQLDRIRANQRAPAVLVAGIAGFTVWMLAAAIAAVTLTLLEASARTESTRTAMEIAQIRAERDPLLKREKLNAAAKSLAAKSRVPAASVLGRVAAAAPDGIAITRIAVNADGKLAIEGNAVNTATMEQFALSLGQSAAIKRPYFDMMRQDDKGGLSFRIAGSTRASTVPAPGTAGQEQPAAPVRPDTRVE